MKKLALAFASFLIALAAITVVNFSAQPRTPNPEPRATKRPPIIGVANIGLKTDDMKGAEEFYGTELGLEHGFSLTVLRQVGSYGVAYFKVNDHQYVEVYPTLKNPKEDRLDHIAFETTDIKKLRDYMAARGVKVPDKPVKSPDGNLTFEVTDPDGHTVEFVQYIEGSLERKNFGKFMPATRISKRMIHVGVTVQDQAAADRFYRDVLGFKAIWHGGMKDDRTDWVDMRVPEGTDWLEYMLNVHNPSPRTLGVMHHLALGVPSVAEGYKTVVARGYKAEEPKVGRDGKWQLNLYDPNLTRVELMEPKPVEKPCCSPMLQ
jgi:catechol 2,3-dioxygenase-like lactoylglutathione lyase family enzyme